MPLECNYIKPASHCLYQRDVSFYQRFFYHTFFQLVYFGGFLPSILPSWGEMHTHLVWGLVLALVSPKSSTFPPWSLLQKVECDTFNITYPVKVVSQWCHWLLFFWLFFTNLIMFPLVFHRSTCSMSLFVHYSVHSFSGHSNCCICYAQCLGNGSDWFSFFFSIKIECFSPIDSPLVFFLDYSFLPTNAMSIGKT